MDKVLKDTANKVIELEQINISNNDESKNWPV